MKVSSRINLFAGFWKHLKQVLRCITFISIYPAMATPLQDNLQEEINSDGLSKRELSNTLSLFVVHRWSFGVVLWEIVTLGKNSLPDRMYRVKRPHAFFWERKLCFTKYFCANSAALGVLSLPVHKFDTSLTGLHLVASVIACKISTLFSPPSLIFSLVKIVLSLVG